MASRRLVDDRPGCLLKTSELKSGHIAFNEVDWDRSPARFTQNETKKPASASSGHAVKTAAVEYGRPRPETPNRLAP
jgi:hypothetical protein